MKTRPIPLVVDIDGTLISSDLLWESFFSAVKSNPATLFLVLLWLFKGRAYLKRQLALRSKLSVKHLPYRKEVLQFIETTRERDGCDVFLATAADEILAKQVESHLGGFSGCFASNGESNLKGAEKAKLLRREFPEGFSYVGDSKADTPVFEAASNGYLVTTKTSSRSDGPSPIAVSANPPVQTLLRTIRAHQWVKNLLIFVPLLTSHRLNDLGLVVDAILGFVSFSLIASTIYILNDLLDLDEDRQHRTKKYRPIAAGNISIPIAICLMFVLSMSSFALALFLPYQFGWVLLSYLGLTVAYSFFLKGVLMLDVVVLACLYTTRIVAGVMLMGSIDSLWILLFAIFIFLSLAIVKRVVELSKATPEKKLNGRAYIEGDQSLLSSIGISSGLTAVLVFTLYIQTPAVYDIYKTPELLWLISPILIYWICRMWLLIARGRISDDPIVFAIKDRVSYLVFALIACIVIVATEF